MLFLASLLFAADPAMTLTPGITYATVGGEALKLDLVVPVGKGPFPVVVCLHGGAWKYGSRKDVVGGCHLLARQGYAAAAVSYRLAPKHKWPAQIEDAKTAVRFLRENAAKYSLDPDRVAALGFSAGGHLAALLGTTDAAAGFDGPLYPKASSRVACVVDYFGPADLPLYAETPGIEKAYMGPFLGTTFAEKPDVFKKASPVEHCSKDDAPHLILHGTADIIVPIIHSERLRDKLTAVGVPVEYVTVPVGGHGWVGPDAVRTNAVVEKFLAKHLAAGRK